MTVENDKESEVTPKLIKSRVVGSDEMLVHRQIERHLGERKTPVISFRETLALRLMHIESYFTSNGWPPFSKRVLVGDADGNGWLPIEKEWEEKWLAEGLNPQAEPPSSALIRIEVGLHFISRRVSGFSDDSWAIAEAMKIRAVLDAQNMDDAIEAAHALGKLHQQQHSHEKYLPAVRRKLKQIGRFREQAPIANTMRRKEAATWHARAVEIAEASPMRTGGRITRELINSVRTQLRKEQILAVNGETPSERTIRRVLQEAKIF